MYTFLSFDLVLSGYHITHMDKYEAGTGKSGYLRICIGGHESVICNKWNALQTESFISGNPVPKPTRSWN